MANQPNCSFNLQEKTLNNFRILARLSGKSINRLANEVLEEFVARFSAEIAEFENFARTAARKVQEKISGYDVTKIKLKKIPTNDGARLAAVMNDQIITMIQISTADEKKATEFVERAMTTIGSHNFDYEIVVDENEKSITATVKGETFATKFEDAGTAAKVEALIDEICAQITKKAFQNQEF